LRTIISFTFVLIVVFYITGCKKNDDVDISPEQIAKKVITELQIENMSEVTEKNLSAHYNISIDKLSDFSVYITNDDEKIYDVAVFLAKKADDIPSIKAAISERTSHKATVLDTSKSTNLEILHNNVLETKGLYVFFAITENSQKARSIFEEFFN